MTNGCSLAFGQVPCVKCDTAPGKTGPHPAGCTPENRFWRKVRVVGACWEWQGANNGVRYGVLRVTSRIKMYAHRYAYEQVMGPVPDGLLVMHSCDNPRCVRPAHLSIGTYRDNNADMRAKGRARPGIRTCCRNGHAYTPENTGRDREGYRCCLACRKDQRARRRAAA